MGFRQNPSTETTLITITGNIDNNKTSLLLLLDLFKAFDRVTYILVNILVNDILVNKCMKMNVEYFWVRNYLKSRQQCVRIQNVTSTRKIMFLLESPGICTRANSFFSIYVNGLSKCLTNCLMVQYADDTQLLLTFHTISKVWFSEWQENSLYFYWFTS